MLRAVAMTGLSFIAAGATGCGEEQTDAANRCDNLDVSYPIRSHTFEDGRVTYWLIGHDWDVWGQEGSLVTEPGPEWLTELVWGTDLGMSVIFRGRRIFYFGDTWRWEDGQTHTARWCDPGCTEHGPLANCAQCDDAMAISDDADPSDGLTLYEVPYRVERRGEIERKRFFPIAFPGLHYDIRQDAIWGSPFSVPSGALALEQGGEEAVLLWYATGMREDNGVRSRSWLGRSRDGTTFESCFPPEGPGDRVMPFSEAPAPGGRFINVGAVEVGAPALEGCEPLAGAGDRGVLMFGAGMPYRQSDVYMAYAPAEALCARRCQGDDCDHKNVVYFTGVPGACWSPAEADAAPLLRTMATTAPAPYGTTRGIGELSVKRVPGLGLVMLSNETWCNAPEGCTEPEDFRRGGVALRWAPADRPWAWSAPIDTGANGYGPYMLDGHISWDATTRTLSVWHTASTWRGVGLRQSPYGVQLTRSDVVIP